MAKKQIRTKKNKQDRAKLMNEIVAAQVLLPSAVNAGLIKNLHNDTNFGNNDFGEKIEIDAKRTQEALKMVSDKVRKGDLTNLEDMLTSQAFALQSLFTNMATKATLTDNAQHIELLSKIALKAQNQCRTTIATLSEMKNPKRAMFVKQLNQANQMQVNNTSNTEEKIQKKNTNPANELLEKTDGDRMDTRTTQETISNDEAIETVAEINRT